MVCKCHIWSFYFLLMISIILTGCSLSASDVARDDTSLFEDIDSLMEDLDENTVEDSSGDNGVIDIENNPDLEKVTLVRVVDGDTIVVLLGEEEIKVRLIGINTPESVHADESKNTEEGDMASEFTKGLLADVDILYLEYDLERLDQYGRTLAYVWLSTDTNDMDNMLNTLILKGGYAEDVVYKPNMKYSFEFELYHDIAMHDKVGLWEMGLNE